MTRGGSGRQDSLSEMKTITQSATTVQMVVESKWLHENVPHTSRIEQQRRTRTPSRHSFRTDLAAPQPTSQSDKSGLGLDNRRWQRHQREHGQERARAANAKSSRVAALSTDVRSISTLAYPSDLGDALAGWPNRHEGRNAWTLEAWTVIALRDTQGRRAAHRASSVVRRGTV